MFYISPNVNTVVIFFFKSEIWDISLIKTVHLFKEGRKTYWHNLKE